LVEDTPSLQLVYQSVLKQAGHNVTVAGTAAEGLAAFRAETHDVMLLDLMLPDRDGLDLMRDCLDHAPDANVIVITANGSINKAVEAMRAGAYDFLVKPFDEQRLLNSVANACVNHTLPDTKDGHFRAAQAVPRISGFIGTSPAMRDIYGKIISVAQSMATIFISGESGTGKEVCAQAVHAASPRRHKPFVPLNCAAIPGDLLESEVFGHLKGSFTGAISDKEGAAAAADGGTLFLDEICEMDLALQAKLLRFLQTSTIQPLGSTRPRKVNVRIICATNRDPMEEVASGRFREDLFYRLYVVPMDLPPLRARGRDVLEIAETLLKRVAAEEGKSFQRLSPKVAEHFMAADWPGNVRQLLNVIRNVVVLNDGDEVTPSMLPPGIATYAAPPVQSELGPRGDPIAGLAGLSLAEVERRVIEAALDRHGGSVPKAARELDVSPSTLYRKREAWAESHRSEQIRPVG